MSQLHKLLAQAQSERNESRGKQEQLQLRIGELEEQLQLATAADADIMTNVNQTVQEVGLDCWATAVVSLSLPLCFPVEGEIRRERC